MKAILPIKDVNIEYIITIMAGFISAIYKV